MSFFPTVLYNQRASVRQISSFEGTGKQAAGDNKHTSENMDVGRTYRAVQHHMAFVSTLLDVVFQGARVERLQKFKAAQKL